MVFRPIVGTRHRKPTIARDSSLEIDAVINLALPTSSNALIGEAERITELGISYFHIPVEWEAPQLEQAKMFFDALNMLRGRKVWVHCAKNMRVSAFIYLYRRLCLSECDETAAYPMNLKTAVEQKHKICKAYIL